MSNKFSQGSATESAAKLAQVTSCFSPSFSPDGKLVAFVSDVSGIPQIWIVSSEGGWPQRVTALGDPISEVRWSPTGEWLAFSLDPGGGMNQQVYLVRPDGSELRCLTDNGKETNWLGPWSQDGRALAIASNRRSPEAMDSYLIDTATRQFQRVAEAHGTSKLIAVDLDAGRVILYRRAYRGDNDLFVVDLNTRRETLLTPHESPANFTNAQVAPDGQTVYLISDDGRERAALVRGRLIEHKPLSDIESVAERDDADLREFALIDDGLTAVLLWNVAGRSELTYLTLTTLQASPGPELPVEVATNLTYSKENHLLMFTGTGATAPRNVWVLNKATGTPGKITDSSHPGINLSRLVNPKLVYFKAHDGLDLSAWLYVPEGFRAPGPMVLSFHGGPEEQERPVFDSTYQTLLAQGVAIFAPNVRGSAGFGKTFVNLDNGALRSNAVRDILTCAEYVINGGIAQSGRIGIMGGSYGGYMTMSGLTEYPGMFAAGVNIYGVVNFKTFFEYTEPWMAAISKGEYGDPDSQAAMLENLSPVRNLDLVNVPVLVLHGANDTNVPVIEAEQVVNRLLTRGVTVEYILFPDEGHGFVKEVSRVKATVSIVGWFVRYLKIL